MPVESVRLLNQVAKERTEMLDRALEALAISESEAQFSSFEEMQEAINAFGTCPALFAARFGTSLAAAESLAQLGDLVPPAKRPRVPLGALQFLHKGDCARISSPAGAFFRLLVHRCSGDEFVKILANVEAGDSLAGRAREAASRLARCGSLAEPCGRWDLPFLVIDRLEASVRRASQGNLWDPEHNLGVHPRFYIALVHVELVMRGVVVKLARTDADADMFVDELHAEM